MKIAVVSIGSFDTQYSDYHIMRDIILGLLKRGHEVFLVQKQYLATPQYPAQFKNYLGHELQVHNIRYEKKAKNNLKARYLADLSYYRLACRQLRKSKPDKIFLQSCNTAFYPIFYAKHILKCPLIYNEQDIFPENAYFAGILSEKNLIYRIAYFLQKYAYKNASSLTTISEDMKDTIANRYKIRPEKIGVIYNWGHEELEANKKTENAFLLNYPKKKGEYRVVYAGNLGRMQNVELVLKVAAQMKEESDITFYIVGNGANEEKLKLYAKENNLTNTTFVGMQPPEQVADLYASADINIIPLQKKLIYAALPSKTADCLMAESPILTCVDEDSKFAKLVKQYGIENADPDQTKKLKSLILKTKSKAEKGRNFDLWNDYFKAERSIALHCESIELAK